MTEVPQKPSYDDPNTTDPDLLLIGAVAAGDRQALAELYARNGRGILSYLIGQLNDRQLAEEVLQDVMLAAWEGASNFRGDSKVRTWLLAIARRKVLNIWRKKKLKSVELKEEIVGGGSGLSTIMERQDTRDTVREALHALPDDQRETLELVFYQEMTGVEAAEIMGVAPGTVKSRLHRAKNTLRGLLQRKEVGDEYER